MSNFVQFQPIVSMIFAIPFLTVLIILCVRQIIVVKPHKYDVSKMTWFRRLVMIILLGIIALGPSVSSQESRIWSTNLDILFVVDTTGSMSAEDQIVDGEQIQTRLNSVKDDIEYMSKIFPPAKYCAITFNSSAHEDFPLTSDTRALRTWADSLSVEITTYSSGTDLATPVDQIGHTLDSIYDAHPDDRVYLIYMGDGENTNKTDLPEFSEFSDRVFGGAVIGYGTVEGGKMQQYSPRTAVNKPKPTTDSLSEIDPQPEAPPLPPEYIKDFDTGVPAVSKIDETNLKKFASDFGIEYFHRNSQNDVYAFAKSVFAHNWTQTPVQTNKTVWNLFIWPFAVILSVLLIWEMFIQILLHTKVHMKASTSTNNASNLGDTSKTAESRDKRA